jgi:hypothetical protein
MAAAQTFQANIGSEAHDLPFVTATGVRLTQFDHIVDLDVWQHVKIISHVIFVNKL